MKNSQKKLARRKYFQKISKHFFWRQNLAFGPEFGEKKKQFDLLGRIKCQKISKSQGIPGIFCGLRYTNDKLIWKYGPNNFIYSFHPLNFYRKFKIFKKIIININLDIFLSKSLRFFIPLQSVSPAPFPAFAQPPRGLPEFLEILFFWKII